MLSSPMKFAAVVAEDTRAKMASSNTSINISPKNFKGKRNSNGQAKKNKRMVDPITHRLNRAQKGLIKGQITMIGDGLYETQACKGCSKQHRLANIDICQGGGYHNKTCHNNRGKQQTCTLPSILSKPSSLLSSTDSLPSIKIASQVSLQKEDPVKGTVPFSREFCREMLNKEEIVLNERLLFEKKFLEESEQKHLNLELEEERWAIGEQKELEEEKEKLEHARKRRLALETILKTLNDIPEPSLVPISTTKSSKQKLSEEESNSSGGILRYNYSTASRKAVRIKGSSDEATSKSNSSSLSKYLTFASSHYLTTSSSHDRNTEESSSDESIIIVNVESFKNEPMYYSSASAVESKNVPIAGDISSVEKKLKPTENFMIPEESVSTPQITRTTSSFNKKEDAINSAPALTSVGSNTTTHNVTQKTSKIFDKAKSEHINSKSTKTHNVTPRTSKILNKARSEHMDSTPTKKRDVTPKTSKIRDKTKSVDNKKSKKNISKTTLDSTEKKVDKTDKGTNVKKSVELTIPNLIITAPSRNEFVNDTAAFTAEEPSATNDEQRDNEKAIIEKNESLANTASADNAVSTATATSSTAMAQKNDSNTNTSRSRASMHQQSSNCLLMARSIVRKALETVMLELIENNDDTLLASSTPLVVSSEEYLTQTATLLVRNAIVNVQKDLLKQVTLDNKSSSTRSVSFSFLKTAKSLKKIFSF